MPGVLYPSGTAGLLLSILSIQILRLALFGFYLVDNFIEHPLLSKAINFNKELHRINDIGPTTIELGLSFCVENND
ncbi:MAG: hypothetical protein K9H64_02445 [Bacteroidales bacterium]|nr:hypothetical protein [Bacteroidales bacterium]MCF8454902.1 hypothetical protein [Bacteroidales bacterium]